MLGTIAERYGLAAFLAVLMILSFGFAIWKLWKVHNDDQKALRDLAKAESAKRSKLRTAIEEEKAALRADIAALKIAHAEAIAEERKLREALHEKRHKEGQGVVRELIEETKETRSAIKNTAEALTFLRETLGRRE